MTAGSKERARQAAKHGTTARLLDGETAETGVDGERRVMVPDVERGTLRREIARKSAGCHGGEQ